ncbi:MAG: hypothetical protein MZU95_03900 [Desulfomicrobium escambiense]|nr:hypothetical protein [Desulfomicrobium escambiense]
MGFVGYFLIVCDFINYAKQQGIPVGPGPRLGGGKPRRPTPSGSPTIDPIRYDLLFERFLNPDRMSMPDIDIDFCTDRPRRGHPVRHREIRPRPAWPRSSPSARCRPRAVIRDVGRALDMPYGEVDRIAKLIPQRR